MNLFLTSVADGVRSIDALKNMINERTKLVILPFAHDFKWLSCAEDVYEKYDRCPRATNSIFWRTVKPFTDIGIDVNNIVVINRFSDPVGLIKHKLLSDNTIVYLPGGRPENIMKTLKALTLTETIKQCKTVVGESAGSMIWSKYYFVYPDADYKRYKSYKGLGIVSNCVFIPHFQLTGDHRRIAKSARRFSWFHKDTIYLVEDGGWIHYNTESKRIIKRKNAIKY